MSERPQRNLALELVRCTEAAALAAAQFMGTGNQEAGDQAAVDAVEGTRLLALGRPNAISVIALAERWSMWNPGPSLYMDKIVVDKRGRDVIDLTQSPTDNLNHSFLKLLKISPINYAGRARAAVTAVDLASA